MDFPECEQCHGNHLIRPANDDMLGVDEGASCIECHDPDSPGYIAAARMKSDINTLKVILSKTENTIRKAEQKGVESGQAIFELSKSRDALIQARSVIHTFESEKVAEIVAPAIENTEIVKQKAIIGLKDLRNRQYGLGATLVIIILIIVALLIEGFV